MSKKNKDLENDVLEKEQEVSVVNNEEEVLSVSDEDKDQSEVNDEEVLSMPDEEEEAVEATATVRLNIREQPSDSSETNIVTIVNAGASLIVYPNGSTPIFYRVKTSSGIEGFAMRRFVILDAE